LLEPFHASFTTDYTDNPDEEKMPEIRMANDELMTKLELENAEPLAFVPRGGFVPQ
jgi:hypothetical protein